MKAQSTAHTVLIPPPFPLAPLAAEGREEEFDSWPLRPFHPILSPGGVKSILELIMEFAKFFLFSLWNHFCLSHTIFPSSILEFLLQNENGKFSSDKFWVKSTPSLTANHQTCWSISPDHPIGFAGDENNQAWYARHFLVYHMAIEQDLFSPSVIHWLKLVWGRFWFWSALMSSSSIKNSFEYFLSSSTPTAFPSPRTPEASDEDHLKLL